MWLRRRLCLALLGLLALFLCPLLLPHLRGGIEILPCEDDQRRQDDGEDEIFIVSHRLSCLARRLAGSLSCAGLR